MDMSGMSGMDMTGTSMFQTTNTAISHLFWYLVAAVVGVGLLAQIWQRVDGSMRIKAARNKSSILHPSVPTNSVSQAYATARTIFRELAYPQGFYISKPGFQWLTPPPVGKCLMILTYWITITVMLTSNSISSKSDAYYFERIGFRGAWISVMQVPLIVLLAGKVNIIGILIGSSYERLNWAHRWVSRTLVITATVHASFFLREWIRADFLMTQLEMMPMVVYGMAAGGLLLFMNIVGIAPLRHKFYELFVIIHLASIGTFLWCLYKHVPSYAMYYVWMAIAFVAFDRGVRLIWSIYRNIRIRSKTSLAIADRVGYRTELHALPGDTTRVVIKNVPFTWTPGQHLYLWIPRMGFIETHPFTISNIAAEVFTALPGTSSESNKDSSRNAQLEIRAHSGFSRRLYSLAKRHASKPLEVRSFIQGPFGTHPTWNTFETLVLVSASTGGSFTVPILESILVDPCCVRKCHFILLVRQRSQCSCYLHRLRSIARAQRNPNLVVSVHVAVTGTAVEDEKFEGGIANVCCCGNDKPGVGCVCGSEAAHTQKRISVDSDLSDDQSGETRVQEGSCCTPAIEEAQPASCCAPAVEEAEVITTTFVHEKSAAPVTSAAKATTVSLSVRSQATSDLSLSVTNDVNFLARRPLLSNTIREAVEAAAGETCVVVCGGKPLSGHVRNVVAGLSDERAVHKGTGAQGIALWVEEFGF